MRGWVPEHDQLRGIIILNGDQLNGQWKDAASVIGSMRHSSLEF